MPSRFEPCGLNQLYSMAYGTLPIVRRTGGLADTVEPWTPGAPNATGIVFEHADRAGVAWALGEALRLRHDHPAEFTAMRVRAMTREFPWSRSAESYERCYLEAIRQRRQGFAKDTAEPAKPKPRPPVGSAKKPGKSVVSPKAKA
jgi:starch synthase